jgi:Cof subfamily protein (haloacid dehalogenase superfamily)
MSRDPQVIRLVVTDIDGTLVREDRTLSPATIAAAGRLRAAGIALALVSSRPPRGLDVLLEPLGIDTPRAGFNGGSVLGPDHRVLAERVIDRDVCADAVARLEALGADVWVFGGGAWFLKNPDGAYVPREKRSISQHWRVVADFAPHLDGVHKIMGSSRDFALMARAETALRDRLGARAAVHRSQNYYVDVTHPLANKGEAALTLARLIGADPAAMACLGDMPNDLPMFEVSGLAIAMGNAGAEVRARADVVTLGNDEDGWSAAIDRFIMPRAPR